MAEISTKSISQSFNSKLNIKFQLPHSTIKAIPTIKVQSPIRLERAVIMPALLLFSFL